MFSGAWCPAQFRRDFDFGRRLLRRLPNNLMLPVDTLADLIANKEQRWLRDEPNKAQLTSGTAIDANEMVREVSVSLASLVQSQQRPGPRSSASTFRKMLAYFAGGIGLAAAPIASMLQPFPLVGVAVLRSWQLQPYA